MIGTIDALVEDYRHKLTLAAGLVDHGRKTIFKDYDQRQAELRQTREELGGQAGWATRVPFDYQGRCAERAARRAEMAAASKEAAAAVKV